MAQVKGITTNRNEDKKKKKDSTVIRDMVPGTEKNTVTAAAKRSVGQIAKDTGADKQKKNASGSGIAKAAVTGMAGSVFKNASHRAEDAAFAAGVYDPTDAKIMEIINKNPPAGMNDEKLLDYYTAANKMYKAGAKAFTSMQWGSTENAKLVDEYERAVRRLMPDDVSAQAYINWYKKQNDGALPLADLPEGTRKALDDYMGMLDDYSEILRDRSDMMTKYGSSLEYERAVKEQKGLIDKYEAQQTAVENELPEIQKIVDYRGEHEADRKSKLVAKYLQQGYDRTKANYMADQAIAKERDAYAKAYGYDDYDAVLGRYEELKQQRAVESASKRQYENAKKAEEIEQTVAGANDFTKYVQEGERRFVSHTQAENQWDERYYDWIQESAGNDTEYQTLLYYYGKGDGAGMKAYHDSIAESVNYRNALSTYQAMEGHRVIEDIFGLAAGADQFKTGLENWAKNDNYIVPSAIQMTSSMVREDRKRWKTGTVGYDIITTTANMLPAIAAGMAVNMIAPGAGVAIGGHTIALGTAANGIALGASAGGHAYAEMINAGYSRGQAATYGVLNGALEAGLEYVLNGIAALGKTPAATATAKLFSDNLMKASPSIMKAMMRYATKFGAESISEGVEEFLQDVFDPFIWKVCAGEWKRDENGQQVYGVGSWEDALYSGLLGILSAMPFNAVSGGSENTSNYQTVLRAVKNGDMQTLVDLGLSFDPTSNTYALAKALQTEANLEKPSLKDKTRAAIMVESMAGDISGEITRTVRGNLQRQGVTGTQIDTMTKYISEAVENGTMLSEEGEREIRSMPDVGGKTAQRVAERAYNQAMDAAGSLAEKVNTYSSLRSKNKTDAGKWGYDFETAGKWQKVTQALQKQKARNDQKIEKLTLGVDSDEVFRTRVDEANGATPVRIENITDSGATLKLSDGKTVNAADVKYKDAATALMYETVIKNKLRPDAANAIVASIRVNQDTGSSVYTQLKGMIAAYRAGLKNNVNAEISGITEAQRKIAFEAGRKAAGSRALGQSGPAAPADIARKRRAVERFDRRVAAGEKVSENEKRIAEKLRKEVNAYEESRGKGENVQKLADKVHYIGNAKENLKGALRNVSVTALGLTISAIAPNLDVYMYSSHQENGRRVLDADIPGFPNMRSGDPAPNGFYANNAVYIDINAGEQGQGAVLWTAGHELTHFIRQWSPERFRTLADYLMDTYRNGGEDIDTLVQKQIDLGAANGHEYSYEDGFEEVVANAMGTMLTDGDLSTRLVELSARDKGLVAKMHAWFVKAASEINKMIKSLYGKMQPETREAQILKSMPKEIDRIADAFAVALKEAGENFEAAGVRIDTATESVTPQMSLRSWSESEYVQDRTAAVDAISKALGVPKAKAKQYIDDVNSIAKMIADDRVRLDYDAAEGLSAFVSNVEYGGSFDFSTICAKRRYITGTIQAIQKAIGEGVLSPIDILKIRNMMKARKYVVNCGLCYVEGSRSNMGKFAKEFINRYKKHNPDATWIPKMQDVFTPVGVENMRTQHPDVYSQYETFWNNHGKIGEGDTNLFARQQKPKQYQMRTDYKGEILDLFKDPDAVKNKNVNGGIRFQSFSDFELVHAIDMMQAIMDMSRVGLAGQAYTKVPEMAWMFGNTGLKINLSLIAKGLDSGGKLVFDDVEGMPHDEAFKIRDNFSKNVGTILVVFDDAQLTAAMADERIDFIIPFHRSQWKKSQYADLGLPSTTKDFTYVQNEKYMIPKFHEWRGKQVKDKATNYMPNTYWDFSKTGKENAEHYLEMCAADGKRPKFYKLLDAHPDGSYTLKQDGSTDGYWKLLIDFKMYDNDGVGSPQEAVRPVFNMGETGNADMDSHSIPAMLQAYEGGHDTFPVAEDVVKDFTKEYKKQNGLKFSDRNNAYMQAVENGDTKIAQQFVDEAAEKAMPNSKVRGKDGKLLRVYHGTDANFWSFEFAKHSGKNGEAEGFGIYLTDNPEVSKHYGERQIEGYANITRPAYGFKKTLTRNELARLIEKSVQQEAATMVEEDGYASVEEAMYDTWISNYVMTYDYQNPKAAIMAAADLILRQNENDADIIYEVLAGMGIRNAKDASVFYDEILTPTTGIDGIWQKWNEGDKEKEANIFLAFRSEQIKSADTVTYDDNGNIIPLSERFNEQDSDIRFSARFPELTNIDTFPQYDESGGSSASSLALRWARQPDVKAGDWKLAYYRGRWYTIEKFDSVPDKYQVTRRLKKSMYETYRRMWEEQYGRKPEETVAGSQNRLDNLDRKTTGNRERRSDIDDDVFEHTGKNNEVFKLDKNKDAGQRNGESNSGTGGIGGNEDRQGDGTSAGRGVPEVKLSDRDRASMTEERIDWLIRDNGAGKRTDYARGWITTISPTDFINLTTKEFTDRNKFDRMKNDYGTTMADYDYMRELKENKRETPYLAVDMNTGEVVGHEGRHRMRALEQAGVTSVPIKIEFRDENGYVAKEMNGYGNPLETIAEQALTNQYGNGYTASVANVMPLMQTMRDEIIAAYGQKDSSVRYDLRDPNAASDRDVLSSVRMEAATNDVERDALQRYQQKEARTRELETRLADTRNQARELDKSGKTADKAKAASLRKVAEDLTRQINIAENDLRKMERSRALQSLTRREQEATGPMTKQERQERAVNNARLEERARAAKQMLKQEIDLTKAAGTEINAMKKQISSSEKTIAKQQEQIDKYKALSEKRKAEIEHRKEMRLKERDQRASSDLIGKIRELRNTMVKSLNEGRGKKAVPEQFVRGLMDVCEAIDPSPKMLMVKKTDAEGRPVVSKTGQQIYRAVLENEFTPEQIEEGLRNGTMRYTGSNERANIQTKNAALQRLRDVYDSLSNSKDPDMVNAHDDEFSNYIRDLKEALGEDKAIRDMSRKELQQVYDVMKQIWKHVTDAKRLIGVAYSESLEEARNKITRETNALPKKIGTSRLADADRSWLTNPIRVMREMTGYNDDAQLSRLFMDVVNGWIKGEEFRMKAEKTINAMRDTKADKKKYSSACFDGVIPMTDAEGNEFEISLMQGIQVLLTYEREISNENHQHLVYPIYFEDLEQLKKGNEREAIRKAHKASVADPEVLNRISDAVYADEWAVRFMDAAKDVFRTKSTNAMNETSMVLEGVPIAREKAYIPYQIVPAFKSGETENVERNISVRNLGMTKRLIPNAETPLLMGGVQLLLEKHIDDVAKYYGLAIPIRNWNAVLNYGKKADRIPVVETLSNRWRVGYDVLDQAIADIQGPRPNSDKASFDALRSAFVEATLLGNISVTIKQMASYPTAGVYLSQSSLLYGVRKFLANARHLQEVYERIDSITPMLYMRRQGLSIQEIAELKHSKWSWINEKMGVVSPANWIQSADVNTTTALFFACEHEVGKTTKNTDPTYTDKVRALYEKVLSDTQPMYDPLHRAELSKSKGLARIFMFKTQPLQNSGILKDATQELRFARAKYGKGSEQVKEAGGKFAGAVLSQMATALTFTAMTMLASAIKHSMNHYRDDDDELTWKSIGQHEFLDMIQQAVNVIIPVVGETAWGVIENIISKKARDVITDPTLDMINDAVSSLMNFVSKAQEGELTYESVAKPITNILAMCGVPAKNLENFLKGIWYHIQDAVNGQIFSFEAGIERSTTVDQKRLYEAIVGKKVKQIEEFKKTYNTQDEFHQDIQHALGEYEDRIADAAKLRYEGDLAAYKNMAYNIWSGTLFDEADIKSAINSKIKSLRGAIKKAVNAKENGLDDDYKSAVKSAVKAGFDKAWFEEQVGDVAYKEKPDWWTEETETDAATVSWYSKEEISDAIVGGDASEIKMIRDDLYKEYKAKGKEKPTDEVNSDFTSAIKDLYNDKRISYENALKYLQDYTERDKDKAYWKLEEWKYVANHPKEKYTNEVKFSQLTDAVGKGEDIGDLIDYYTSHGVTKDQMANAITDKYADIYRGMSTSERYQLKQKLLKAYVKLGFKYKDRSTAIDKWLKQKKEE